MKPEHDFQDVSFAGTATLERPEPEEDDDEPKDGQRRFTKSVFEAIARQKNLWPAHPNDAKALEGISQDDIDAYWTALRTPVVWTRKRLSEADIAELQRTVVKLINSADPLLRVSASLVISKASDDHRKYLKSLGHS